MVKKITLCLLFLMLFPIQINAANTVKVSFIRQGNLWVYDNGTERQLSYARHASMSMVITWRYGCLCRK